MKRALALLLTAGMIFTMSGCGSEKVTGEENISEQSTVQSNNEEAGGTETTQAEMATDSEIAGSELEIAVIYTGNQAAAFQEIVDGFEKEYQCEVNIAEYGADYESTLKTRMAANDLPDVFMTHGWSVIRYKEYLIDLRNEPWVQDYDESALGVIQDDDGSIYVMMIAEGINGTVVNKQVCDAAGVDPYSIHTWNDFTDACEKIKEAGYTPISVIPNPGLLANIAGTWVSYEGEASEDSEAMLNGSWNWESYKGLLDVYAEWIDAGYFYDDVMTMNDSDLVERYASGKAAFCLGNGPEIMLTCQNLNPEQEYLFLPSFASKEGGTEFVGIGEGGSFGIWKDTENEAAAKVFLEYMTRPEVAIKMNALTGEISCLKSVMEMDNSYGLKVFQTMKENCTGEILYENLWDRKYMPSGMWPIFGNACSMLFDDYSDEGKQEVIDYLKENYQDLYEAAKENS